MSDIDLTQGTEDRTSVAETLAKYFWTLRVTDGENLPGWDELSDEERQGKIEGADEYLSPILAPLLEGVASAEPTGTADEQARIHVAALLRRPEVTPEARTAAEDWLRTQPVDTSMEAIRERHGTEPATTEEFEAEHGPVGKSDGEG
jgi:hypothetical protein